MKRKLVTIMLAGAMALSICGCGGKKDTDTPEETIKANQETQLQV